MRGTSPEEQLRTGAPASRIATLFPGYFALVMATGIVAVAAELRGVPSIAAALLAVAVVSYLVLWALLGVRIARYPRLVASDLTSHQKGAGFLTIVAGTNVLGAALLVTGGAESAAWRQTSAEALWFSGLVLWAGLLYAFVIAVTVRREKPTLDAGIGGVWLLLVVSTESVAVLGVRVSGLLHADWILFTSLSCFLIGAMLYVVIIGLVFYRWTFFPMGATQLTPPYWINMGALAIATLAGALLLGASETSPLLQAVQPFVAGLTVAFWAFATWWIPILVVAGIWRHGVERIPLRYDPQYWALVFPLGMYATCSAVMVSSLKAALDIDARFLGWVSPLFFWIALVAWVVVFVGMVVSLAPSKRSVIPAPPSVRHGP